MQEGRPPRILIYQGLWKQQRLPEDGECDCEFTYDRSRWEDADAVVFHLPQLRESGFPPRKHPGQVWVAWSMESDVNYPILTQRSDLSTVFDLWMTYRRDSDIWCPYLDAKMISGLQAPPLHKTESKPAAAFISSSIDQSGRKSLLSELMAEMPIDSYGKLHRNRVLPNDLHPSAKQAVIGRYKFTLAFENSISHDYVTEKFFDCLLAGTVPVYLGAPNIKEFAPGDNCYIDASRFDGPQALAAHLMEVAADESAYGRLLQWKSQPLRPAFMAMLAELRIPAFCRLADRLRQRRDS